MRVWGRGGSELSLDIKRPRTASWGVGTVLSREATFPQQAGPWDLPVEFLGLKSVCLVARSLADVHRSSFKLPQAKRATGNPILAEASAGCERVTSLWGHFFVDAEGDRSCSSYL